MANIILLSTRKEKKGVYIVAPLIATITGFLEAYASASRVAIVREIMYIFILLMLFKNSLDKKMRKKILKIFIILNSATL